MLCNFSLYLEKLEYRVWFIFKAYYFSSCVSKPDNLNKL